jgi:hypothetical protein
VILLGLGATLASCDAKPAPPPPPPPPAAASAPSEPEAPFAESELSSQAVRLSGRADVRLTGPAIPVEAGDWLLENDETTAIVSTELGAVLGLGPRGGESGLELFGPAAFDPFDELAGDVERVAPAVGGRALYIVKRLRARPLRIEAWLGLAGRALLLRWRLHAHGPVAAVTPGEIVWWGNTPSWIEGHGFVTKGGSLSGAFLARRSHRLAYALCREGGRLTARFGSPESPGYHRSPRTGEQRIELAPGASSPMRRLALAWGLASIDQALAALPCKPPSRAVAIPDAVRARTPAGAAAEIARCETAPALEARRERAQAGAAGDERAPATATEPLVPGAPFSRAAIGREPGAVAVPDGCARVRLVAPGHAPGAWIDPDTADLTGWAHPELLPRAGALGWRVRDTEGAVLPAALVVRGEGKTPDPDWGEDEPGGAALGFLYAERDGERPIPPGRYRVTVHRGFEHELQETSVTVRAGETVTVKAELARTVDTRGWIAADLHVHALPSFDAPTLLEDRVRSLAAVGVEVAVATDHNAVTDYRPAIEALGLGAHLASLVGDEVTTEEPRIGHFNVFPLAPGSAPLAFRHARPAELFAAARRAAPEGVVQVNHPRMGSIGYFELYRLDRGAVKRWTEEAAHAPLAFDAIEIFNGDHYPELGAVDALLGDWYALLDAGHRLTATGNSDSHKIAYQEAGMPRNFVALEPDDPARFDAAAFVRAVRAGRVVVSSGPFVELTAGGGGPGDTVPAGALAVGLRVQAPSWMDVAEVELVRRGEVVRRWDVTGRARPRLQARATVTASSGDWLLAIARGQKPMKHLYRPGALPFAFTNPVWVK